MTLLTDPLKRRRICKVLTYQTRRPHYVLTTSSGEYKIILQLVGVLSHGKIAKRLTDNAIDLMQDVQNLRKAIYECVVQPASRAPLTPSLLDADSCLLSGDFSNKLKAEACAKGSTKYTKLFNLAANYLCATVSFFVAKVWALMSLDVRYRYGVLIVFANYLTERRFGEASQDTFPEWLSGRREITKLLGRRSLD